MTPALGGATEVRPAAVRLPAEPATSVRPSPRRGQPWVLDIVAAALGILVVGYSFRLSSRAAGAELYYVVFWAGMILALAPTVRRLVVATTSVPARAAAVVMLGAVTLVPKFLRNPDQPAYHDEYAHWREAIDVITTGNLLRPNSLIPIVQFFPGTSAITAAGQRISGLPVWSSGELVIAVAHILGFVAVFVLGRTLLGGLRSGGARVNGEQAGGIAALIYALNPSALYFDTQYAYESLAINFFLWVLALTAVAATSADRRRRIGCLVGAVFCVAGCVVTHHLTVVFLVAALSIICVTGSLRHRVRRTAATRAAAPVDDPESASHARSDDGRLPGEHFGSWWVVLGATGGLALVWLILIATPTISYLSPYFGNSVTQLSSAAQNSGDGGRELLAASVQPLWERVATALAPVVIGLCFLAGWRIWRREGALWSSSLLGLIVFGLLYLPSVPFVLAPSGAEGARRSWGFSYVGIAVLVALIALHPPRRPARLPGVRQVVAAAALIALLIGNVGGGLNDPYRFPGPFRWATDTDSATDEARTVARVLAAQAGPVRVVTDAYTGLQLVSYGGLSVAAPSAGFPAWDLTQTGDDPPPELAGMLVSSRYDYLVVDIRMGEEAPFNGHNFGQGDPLLGRATPMAYLNRLDAVPWATRIVSTQHLRVYHLDLQAIGAVVNATNRVNAIERVPVATTTGVPLVAGASAPAALTVVVADAAPGGVPLAAGASAPSRAPFPVGSTVTEVEGR